MRTFYTYSSIRDLDENEVDLIEKQAYAGEPVACFKMAQIHLAWRNVENYAQEAYDLLRIASEGGVADADAAIADMLRYGDLGYSDFSHATHLLVKALEKKSEYAAKIHIENLLYGLCGCEADPFEALDILNKLVEESDNPMWYHYKGIALQMTQGLSAAKEWYMKAVDGGYTDSYGHLATALGFDDEYEIVDFDVYYSTIVQGVENNDTLSGYFMALNNAEVLDEYEGDERSEMYEIVVSSLKNFVDYGSTESALLLGNMYRCGLFGTEIDYQEAWDYYLRGSIFHSKECCEAMYNMVREKLVFDGEESDAIAHNCALRGARYGSRRLLVAAVEAYTHGGLTDFASEFEQHLIPWYDTIPDDYEFDDEDEPDDDGRYDAWS